MLMHALALATLPLSVPLQDAPALVTGARVLAADGSSWLEGHAVLLHEGHVERVAPAASIDAPDGTVVHELDGLHLTPGLIDLHTHLVLHPYDEASWNDQVLKESLELRTIRGVVAARATLEAGFTTIRELGTEGAGFADVALRDAVDMGLIRGPRILTATRALVATGCYGPSGFDPRWEVPKGAQEVDGPLAMRVGVRQQIAAGADWVKVYADYRRKPGDASTPTFTLEELEAAVHEATSAGVPVAAHASTDEAIRRAVQAGVKTIEHGTGAGAEVLELMREHGVVLVPTLAAGDAIARYSGWDGSAPDHPRVVAAKAMFARALESGVTIACGGDSGVFTHGTNAREIELMVEYGMSPARALRAATTVAAEVLGRDDLGRIAPGAVADLVAWERDPLLDASSLRRAAVVIQGGVRVPTLP